ncbi:MAG: FAD-dependent monooxygenase [Clostridia bacterium]|nr:FAD-dependent monooxygenase [Clostridia bacterium]
MARIIVAGGGHGGIGAAALLAKSGYDVTVFEKNARADMGYDWTDIFDKKGLFAVGLDLPAKEKYAFKNDMTFVCPSGEHRLRQHTPEDQLEIQMERKDIYDMLISHAEECGVKFAFETPVLGPVMLGNRVAGVRTEKGVEYADLVIDACGADSPVRSGLPAYLGVPGKTGPYEKFYVYRAFYERTADIPEDNFKVLLLHNNVLGISWVAAEEEHTDVLIGRFEPFGMEEVETELASLRKEFPELGEKRVRGGQFVTIPVRQALETMVADGYAAIGDAAFMTVPLIGSGIANSLKAARMLADTVVSDTNGEFSAQTLYPYQRRFFAELGAGLAPIACIKLMLTKVTSREVDYLFASGILNEGDITMGADTTSIFAMTGGMNPVALKIKAAGLVKDKELLKKIGWMAGRIASVVSVCAAMPKVYNKKALAAWAKAYRKCFEI